MQAFGLGGFWPFGHHDRAAGAECFKIRLVCMAPLILLRFEWFIHFMHTYISLILFTIHISRHVYKSFFFSGKELSGQDEKLTTPSLSGCQF